MVASSQASVVVSQKQILVSLWERLGVSMGVSKLEGPFQSRKFFGIECFSPEEKLQHL